MRRLMTGEKLMAAGTAVVLVACWTTQASADTGPYVWHLPFAGLILVAVIVLEALIAHAVVDTSWRTSMKVAAVANVVSALVGIGIATLLGMLMVELRWDSLLDHSPQNAIAGIAFLGMFVCGPFFLSVSVEYLVGRAMLRNTEKGLIRNWAWAANLVSYGGLWVILLLLSLS
jgi:hypothetical protein